MKIIFSVLWLVVFWGNLPKADAFAPVLESGELVKASHYQVGLNPAIYTQSGGGIQMNIFLDGHLGEGLSYRALMGTGTYDFLGQGTVKYVPFPDVDHQPAIGIRGGFFLARKDSVNSFGIEVTPLVSKMLRTNEGPIVPYVAVPLRWVSAKTNFVSTTAAFGCEWFPASIQDYYFTGEIGLELKDSSSYLAVGATLPFDKLKGL